MSLDAGFAKAEEIVKNLPPTGKVQTTQEQKLLFYSYFKQAKEGDINTPKPGMMDFVGKAKWGAWKKLEGTSSDEAKSKYIALLREMLEKGVEAGDDISAGSLKELDVAEGKA